MHAWRTSLWAPEQSHGRLAPHAALAPLLGGCRQRRRRHVSVVAYPNPHLSPFTLTLTLTPTLTLTLTRRYDVVCPFKSAFDLSQAFPEAEFVVCGQSGHSAGEDEHTSELVMACDRFAGKP